MILLDTHAWLWWIDSPDRLSPVAREAIDAEPSVLVAAISCWEVAMLTLRGRIALDREIGPWLAQARAHPRTEIVGLDCGVASAAALLEDRGFPADPADRLIYATAVSRSARLASADRAIARFDPARVVW